MCCTPFASRNVAISCEINWGPLSETNCTGGPNLLNISPNFSIVLSAEVDFMMATSGHLLCASMTTNSILSSTGPAKSAWMRCHGFFGYSHGCSGASCGYIAYALTWRTCSGLFPQFGHPLLATRSNSWQSLSCGPYHSVPGGINNLYFGHRHAVGKLHYTVWFTKFIGVFPLTFLRV